MREAFTHIDEQSAKTGILKSFFALHMADVTHPTFIYCSFGDERRVAEYCISSDTRELEFFLTPDDALERRRALKRTSREARTEHLMIYKMYFVSKEEFITAALEGMATKQPQSQTREAEVFTTLISSLENFR